MYRKINPNRNPHGEGQIGKLWKSRPTQQKGQELDCLAYRSLEKVHWFARKAIKMVGPEKKKNHIETMWKQSTRKSWSPEGHQRSEDLKHLPKPIPGSRNLYSIDNSVRSEVSVRTHMIWQVRSGPMSQVIHKLRRGRHQTISTGSSSPTSISAGLLNLQLVKC